MGPYERCPYCGARLQGRLSVRAVKLAALFLATLGLAGLWLIARHTEIPTLRVDEATSNMNLAYVRLSGRIVRNLNYDPETSYLGFWLGDETGEVYVSAYQDVTEDLLAHGTVPAIGDTVTVAGTLRIREDMVSLTLNVPEHLTLTRPDPLYLKAGNITLLDEGMRVRVTGQVQEISSPYNGLTLIRIADNSGEITVAVDEVVLALTGELPEIIVGQGASITGTVTLYRATPQIALARSNDIVLFSAPPLPDPVTLQPLSSLSDNDQRTTVRVKAQVVLLESLSGGVKARLDDGTAQVTLLLWDDILQALSQPAALDIGAVVEVTGDVALYQGEIEIIPAHPENVTILVPAQPAPWVDIADLTLTDAGRVVRVRGVLDAPYGFSAGVKAQIKDGSGKIVLLFWSDLYEQLSPTPAEGQEVEITGLVDVYRGELELIPRSRYDWNVRIRDD